MMRRIDISILGIEKEVYNKKETGKVQVADQGKGEGLCKVECNKEVKWF